MVSVKQRLTENRFQHTAARRRLAATPKGGGLINRFQHTAARRRLLSSGRIRAPKKLFQHTAARRRLAVLFFGA